MGVRILVLGILLLIFISLGCVEKETTSEPLAKKAEEEAVKEEKGIITDKIIFKDEHASGEISKNKLTKTATIGMTWFINDTDEWVNFIGEKVTIVPFMVNLACGLFTVAFFNETALKELQESGNMSIGEEKERSSLEGYKVTKASLVFKDKETNEKIADCTATGPRWEDISFNAYRDYSGMSSFFGMEIGKLPEEEKEQSPAQTTPTKTQERTQAQTETFKIGDVLSNGQIEFTVNSARKTNYISDYSKPKSGFTYLIVDFSIKNIEIVEGYSFNPNNVEVEDDKHYTYSYSWDSPNLDKYFDMTSIAKGRTKRGELAFEVPKDAESFTFILKSHMWGKGLAYVNLGIIGNPLEIKSARMVIDLVDYNWVSYGMMIEGKEGTGAFYSIKVFVENTGTLPLNPKYDVTISHRGNMIFSQTVSSSLFTSIPPKETKSDDLMLLMVRIDESGSYEVNINLKDEGSDKIMDSASKIVNVQ